MCCSQQLLGLSHVRQRTCTGLIEGLGQAQRVFACGDGVFRDALLRIETAQVEVGLSDTLDQADANRALAPFAGEQFRARRLRLTPIEALEIQIPCS